MLFTYFHFAADENLTRNVLETGITAIAYETLQGRKGNLPPADTQCPKWQDA